MQARQRFTAVAPGRWCGLVAVLVLLVCAPALAQRSEAGPGPEAGAVRSPAAAAPERDLATVASLEPPGAGALKGRWALVLGNQSYDTAPLRNPVNDAKAVAAALRELRWHVEVVTDANSERMRGAVARFVSKLRPTDDALVYYSGHGTQIDGENYLLPVDTTFTSQADVRLHAIDATRTIKAMASRAAGANILILDACRNNPLPATARSGAGGLATIDGNANSLIAYATSPGKTALDGAGSHGTYTGALLEHIRDDGDVNIMMQKVAASVRRRSHGAQTPWTSSSLTQSFFIAPRAVPMIVDDVGRGKFHIREVHGDRSGIYTTRAGQGQVEQLALAALRKAPDSWPVRLRERLLQHDRAMLRVASLVQFTSELDSDGACARDRRRLTQAVARARTALARLESFGAQEIARTAVEADLRPGCPPQFRWKPVVAIAGGTAAALSTVGAIVLSFQASDKWKKAKEACPSRDCVEGPGGALSTEAKKRADLATVLSVAAIATGAASYFLFWPEKESPSRGSSAPALDILLGPGTGRLGATFTF